MAPEDFHRRTLRHRSGSSHTLLSLSSFIDWLTIGSLDHHYQPLGHWIDSVGIIDNGQLLHCFRHYRHWTTILIYSPAL